MAKAELGSREVERVVTVTRTVTEKVVTLELSEEEANTLSVILSRVGGVVPPILLAGVTPPLVSMLIASLRHSGLLEWITIPVQKIISSQGIFDSLTTIMSECDV